MNISVTLKNYRCFSDRTPASFTIHPGHTAVLGPNNAGKSTLLRFFFEFRDLFAEFGKTGPTNAYNGAVRSDSPWTLGGHSIVRPRVAAVFSNDNERPLDFTVGVAADGAPHVVTLRVVVTRPNQMTCELFADKQRLDRGSQWFPDAADVPRLGKVDFRPFMSACRTIADAMYIGPYRTALPVQTTTQYFDLAIGMQLLQAVYDFKTNPDAEMNERFYALLEDLRRLFGAATFDINAAPASNMWRVMLDGKAYSLDDLGSGLSQFIIVLTNLTIRRPGIVFIDEPETGLHPAMQMLFLDAIARRCDRIVATTHSYGLARSYFNRVYAVSRPRGGTSTVTPWEQVSNIAELVGELQFTGHRDLGVEQVALVEGPTDVRVVRQFLRLAGKDHRVLVLPLSGASLIRSGARAELEELKRIVPKINVLIDSERTRKGDPLARPRQQFVTECEQAPGIPCLVLERRAMENYLTEAAVRAVKGEKYRALGPYERLGDLEHGWAKAENDVIARHMTLADIEGTDLGRWVKGL